MDGVMDAVVLRLKMLGYEVTEDDQPALDFTVNKCERAILADINHKVLPDGLFYVLVDMTAGQFLFDKKAEGKLDGIGLDAPVKSITEGDISVTVASESGGKAVTFDALLDRLIHPDANILAAYRRMRW